ncbi:MAG TPA: OpgC domain-containing protein [Vicinamibacterales bacterium]|nr:OpgC domain-containing protein [Vicinamibacterales bacterium]
MPHGYAGSSGTRDLRIDWLRGLAMTCVIVNHSKLSSLLSWFSYERLWVVTAAEVFVLLSGIVLGTVYGRKLARNGWATVVRGLGRRAAVLYAAFVAVTASVLALAAVGVDVRAVAPSDGPMAAWFFAPRTMNMAAWRDVLFMRVGLWPFEIIGLYVWLVAAAVPCLVILRTLGWRWLIGASWTLYVWHQFHAHPLTHAGFESAFPLLAWQLLFVHGIAIGYHRDRLNTAAARVLPWAAPTALVAVAVFAVFAFCNPWTDGPAWLRLRLVSPELFADLYGSFFSLSDLGAGRLLNLAVGLPVAYGALTRYWSFMQPLNGFFITLGQRSLGAFVLHVYALVLLAYTPLGDDVLINTLVQVAILVGTVAILHALQRPRVAQRPVTLLPAEPLAA